MVLRWYEPLVVPACYRLAEVAEHPRTHPAT
jgi:hypothetical protein